MSLIPSIPSIPAPGSITNILKQSATSALSNAITPTATQVGTGIQGIMKGATRPIDSAVASITKKIESIKIPKMSLPSVSLPFANLVSVKPIPFKIPKPPALPSLPSIPALPSLPELPKLPDISGITSGITSQVAGIASNVQNQVTDTIGQISSVAGGAVDQITGNLSLPKIPEVPAPPGG